MHDRRGTRLLPRSLGDSYGRYSLYEDVANVPFFNHIIVTRGLILADILPLLLQYHSCALNLMVSLSSVEMLDSPFVSREIPIFGLSVRVG